jgi:hypothetical protein
MASVVELVAVFIIVVFVIGAAFGVVLIVASGVKAEENVARQRRATTLRDEPDSTLTRGVRRLMGVGHSSGD